MIKKILPLLILCISFSCKKKDKDEPFAPPTTTKAAEPKVSYINIDDGLSIAQLKVINTYTSNLYKITSAGNYNEVVYLDENKMPIDTALSECTLFVNDIIPVNDVYFVLIGNFSVHVKNGGYPLSLSSLLVRKSDGAIFSFGDNMFSSANAKMGDLLFQKDGSGNLYYRSFGGIVYKIDISDPNSIKRTSVIASGQEANYYNMQNDGYFIYDYGNNSTSVNLRIQKPNGGVYPINIPNRNNEEFWLNSAGEIYFVTSGTNTQIHKINFVGDNITIDTLWRSTNDTLKYAVGQMFRSWTQGSFIIRKSNSVLFIDTYFNDKSFEFSETDFKVKLYSFPKLNDYECKFAVSENNCYIGNGYDLYKVSLSNNSYSKLLNTGDYEIYSMSVSKDDIIHLSALKLSNGKNIIAQINASGQLTIIDENVNKVGEAMVRIR
jgi:hypothetical protein